MFGLGPWWSVLKRRQWLPTPVLLPGKSHGWRSLVGCSPWGHLRVGHNWATSLSCIGEGNGNPLQCSCLENPRDRGAWWASVSGVAQSWTRLKRLSSSSSIYKMRMMITRIIMRNTLSRMMSDWLFLCLFYTLDSEPEVGKLWPRDPVWSFPSFCDHVLLAHRFGLPRWR